jgi:DNA-binding SARP family transcriptional activator
MKEQRNEANVSSLPPSFRIWSCGTFRVEYLVDPTAIYEPVRTAQWGGSNYPRLLLKALLCCSGRRARREAILEMLWPQCDPEQATQYLNTATTKLRRVLRLTRESESLLITEKDASSYCLEGQQILWVDTDAALILLRDAERIGRTHVQALPLLEEAARYLDRGAFLEGEEGLWLQKQRKSIEETRYRCQLWLAEAYEQQGMTGQAETILSALLADDPTDEDVLRRLLIFLYRQRMIHKGRRLYEDTKRLLQTNSEQLSQAMMTFAEHLLNEPLTDGKSLV